MKTFPPNTVIVEVDLRDVDDQDQHGPTFYWGRGFIVGALLSAATVADMLGYGWNAFRF